MAAGLVAALPWITLLASALILGVFSAPLLLVLVPVGLAGGFFAVRQRGLLRSQHAIVRLTTRDSELWAERADGCEYQATVAGNSRLTGPLVLLQISPYDTTVKSGFRPCTVVLLGGKDYFSNTRNQPFREFRVWLRLNHTASEAA